MVINASSHGRAYTSSSVDPTEIVVHEVKADRMHMVLQFLAERVRQPSESPDLHSHRQIGSLDIASGNVPHIWIASNARLARTRALGGAVAMLIFFGGWRPIDFHQLREVNIPTECILDSPKV